MKILYIEDATLIAEGIKKSLSSYPSVKQFDMIHEETTLSKILDQIDSTRYDLLLIDINLHQILNIDGMTFAKKLLKKDPTLKIAFFTTHNYPVFLQEAKEIGARGYINKNISVEDFVRVIEKIVREDQLYFKKDGKNDDANLTCIEYDILCYYAKGYKREKVAEHFNISKRTLANHLNRIYSKLEVHNFQEMIIKGIELGYLKEHILR